MERVPSSTAHTAVAAPAATFQWDTIHRLQRVQVFGADEGVGREVALELLRHGHPSGGLVLYGRRPGQLPWRDESLTVGPIHGNTPAAELAILCTNPELARKLVPILLARGTRVIDQSGAHRGDADVPLVLADLNPQEIGAFAEVVAVPAGTTALLATLLAGLDRVVGLAAVDAFVQPATAGLQLADPGLLERELAGDLARLLGRPDLPLDFFVVDGVHERCSTFALRLQLRTALELGALTGLLAAVPGVQLLPEPTGPLAPAPAACVGGAEIQVGRIRTGRVAPGRIDAGSAGAVSLCCFAVGDTFRAGAALAALRVAACMPAGV